MIEKYASYSVDDFVSDELFIEWVKQPQAASHAFWECVLDTYPQQASAIAQAKRIVAQLADASLITFPKEDIQEIWQSIDDRIPDSSFNPAPKRSYQTFWMMAASLFLAIGLGWVVYHHADRDTVAHYDQLIRKREIQMREVVNNENKIYIVKLPDGSTVHLEKNSKLSFVKDFSGKTREVYLSGAAFFDVTKNPEKPFIVYAGALVTKVLGTSFTINAFDTASKVNVAVKTGKVSIFANHQTDHVDPETKGIILTPNQQADFYRETEIITRSLVAQPKLVIEKIQLEKFSFNNAPVSDIFTAMENAYGVDFLFDEDLLSACHLTTSLSEESLFEKLDVICEAIGATYKVVDAQVVITGRKCN